jgi:hypothetical protein
VLTQSPTNPLVFAPGQLVKIAYRRPETWHWVFSARVLDGDDALVTDPIIVEVHFDLTIGIGRSMVQIPGGYGYFDSRNDPPFESFQFAWGGPGGDPACPRGAQIWSTAVQAPGKSFLNGPVPTKSPCIVNEIVAQDIQLNCRVIAITFPGGPQGLRADIEVSAHFSPKTHLRPEWFKGGSFPGAEDGGGEEGTVARQLERLDKPSGAGADEEQPGPEAYDDDDQGDDEDEISEEERHAEARERARRLGLGRRLPPGRSG